MKINEITSVIERFAPLDLQESYDNAGLIVGRPDDEVHKALVAVDVTEEVLDEAEREGCDLLITHHPVVFRPLKRFNSADHVQRCVERAIRRGIALYACHTNLDSAPDGLSWQLARQLGIEHLRVLQPIDPVRSFAGEKAGFGVVGELPEPQNIHDFLRQVKKQLNLPVIRHSDLVKPTVQKIAVCTGSGASLIGDAQRAEADLYLTADLKYHEFFAPEQIVVADIGHFESEYGAIDFLYAILSKKLHNFAVRKSISSRNPVNYIV